MPGIDLAQFVSSAHAVSALTSASEAGGARTRQAPGQLGYADSWRRASTSAAAAERALALVKPFRR